MKRRIVIGIFAGAAFLLLLAGVLKISYMKNDKMRFVHKMGSGINLGNSLDATGLKNYAPNATCLDYETGWGNPEIKAEQFMAIRKAGFQTVRIPVSFEEHMDEAYVIDTDFLERVSEVTDMALSADLYVILDTHHENWLDLQEQNEKEISEAYAIVWTQIAEHFADYNEQLLFEGMNEPRLRNSEHEWDGGTKELRQMVNRLNRLFIETVRKTGKENKNRYLLIEPYNGGADLREALEELEVPEGNIIVSVHMYTPYDFCQNENGSRNWNDGDERKKELEEKVSNLDEIFLKKEIPVIVTEYGCVDKENNEDRERWVHDFKKCLNQYEIPGIWWENGSTYHIFDRKTLKWISPGLLKEILY